MAKSFVVTHWVVLVFHDMPGDISKATIELYPAMLVVKKNGKREYMVFVTDGSFVISLDHPTFRFGDSKAFTTEAEALAYAAAMRLK